MNIKKTITILFFLSFVLQSCSVVLPVGYTMATKPKIYTHSDVMNSYSTKKEVIRRFGIPNLKDKMERIEIWYYNKGATTTYLSYASGKSNTNLNSNYYSDINVETRANAFGVTARSSHNKYVEF